MSFHTKFPYVMTMHSHSTAKLKDISSRNKLTNLCWSNNNIITPVSMHCYNVFFKNNTITFDAASQNTHSHTFTQSHRSSHHIRHSWMQQSWIVLSYTKNRIADYFCLVLTHWHQGNIADVSMTMWWNAFCRRTAWILTNIAWRPSTINQNRW